MVPNYKNTTITLIILSIAVMDQAGKTKNGLYVITRATIRRFETSPHKEDDGALKGVYSLSARWLLDAEHALSSNP